jgi:polysaccharide biosynthesis transport protein
MEVEQTNVGLEHVLRVLRRRLPLIFLCLLLAGGAAFGFSKQQTKKYTATASLVFNNNQLSQQVAGLQAVGGASNQQAQQNTNVKLVELGDMAEKTAKRLDHGLTKEDIRHAVSVNAQGESNIVNVAATATSPSLATEIANTYVDQFVREQQHSNHAYYSSALALVNKQLGSLSPKQKLSTAGVALENRAQSLGVLAELRNGNVEIAESAALPTGPSAPRTSRNTILGALLGLLLGISIAFMLERLDRRIREPKDLERVYGLPLLGVIPESKALSRSPRTDSAGSLTSGEEESFHLIRAHLRYFNVDRELRTIIVASAAPGDGKTTIARHLAAAAARMGSRVLLMEADLRRPTLAKRLDIPPGLGVSDVLIGAVPLTDAVRSVAIDGPVTDGAPARTLDVLVAGAVLPPNPGELIESRAMETMLERAKAVYDLIVIDSPPLTAVSDAFPLLRKVDGVIIVGRVGRNRRDIAERLLDTLKGVGAPLLGVIANGVKSRGPGAYTYAYSYDYAPSKSAAPVAEAVAANGRAPTSGQAQGQPSSKVEA